MDKSGLLELTDEEREIIRVTFRSIADDLRNNHKEATVPQINRTLHVELDNSI